MAATQYIPQFIPKEYIPANDIGVISNIVAQKEKDLDSSLSLQNQAVDALYGLETTKGFEQGRNAVIDNMQKQIQEVINKRGGDPGAALNDIAAVVSKVRKDPFFGLNRIALEKSKMLDQLQARNPNLYIFNDPRNKEYNPNLTQEDLNFTTLDPEEINKQVLMNYKNLGERQFAGVGTDATGMYNVARYTQGPSERQIQEILNDPESYAAIRQNFPQLANAPKEVADKIIRNQLQIGLRSLQAPDYVDVLSENAEYKSKILAQREYEKYRAKLAGAGFSTYPDITGMENKQKEIDKRLSIVNLGFDKDGNFNPSTINKYEDVVDLKPNKGLSTGKIQKFTMNSDGSYKKEISNSTKKLRSEAESYFNNAKKRYSVIYNQILNNGGTEKDFIQKVADIESKTLVEKTTSIGLNAENGFGFVLTKAKEAKVPAFLDEDGKPVDKAQIRKMAKDAGLTESALNNTQLRVDGDNNWKFEMSDGKETKEFTLNPEAMPLEFKTENDNINELKKIKTNYQLDNEELRLIDRKVFKVGKGFFKVWINPEDATDKKIIVTDPQGNYRVDENDNPIDEVPFSMLYMLDRSDKLEQLLQSNK